MRQVARSEVLRAVRRTRRLPVDNGSFHDPGVALRTPAHRPLCLGGPQRTPGRLARFAALLLLALASAGTTTRAADSPTDANSPAGAAIPGGTSETGASSAPLITLTAHRSRRTDDDDEMPYPGLTLVEPGTSSSLQRKQVLQSLPLQQLSEAGRQKATAVIEQMGLYRHLPTYRFAVQPEVYRYLREHPDVAVQSWRAMGISKFVLRCTAPGIYEADAGDGSAGRIELLLSERDELLIYCEGAFKSPFVAKPITARSLMRVHTQFHTDAHGTILATHTGDVFVAFPSQTVETVAKVISPVSYTIADRNFKQLTLYAHMMSTAMTQQPGWVEILIDRMQLPEPANREFAELAARVQNTAPGTQARAVSAGKERVLTPQEVLTPWQEASTAQTPDTRLPVQPVSATPRVQPAPSAVPASRAVPAARAVPVQQAAQPTPTRR